MSDKLPIGHKTYQCRNPNCSIGRWGDGTRKFVSAKHFSDNGVCLFQIPPKRRTILCLAGSHKLGLVKGRVYPVVELVTLGKNDHRVKITVQKQDRRQTLYVPLVHKNNLDEFDGFNVYDGGDPTSKARMAFRTGE